ncbi:hypothetical protein GCM10025869_09150 [Homoserinibacter gongjuensis]|uniref:1,4-dihydroxy-2-naphthoate octaprenyltransferase n=1 Tax=Homoserinibacter gongjuensis TaxID=1162968 RepID=A0ABQ6JQ29_9MICO|nr:hypothetical protein GCM10025869_09150 [Homoserinibacter gongjuensis]
MAKQQRFDPQALERARGNAPSKKAPAKGKPSGKKTRGKSGRPGGRPPAEATPATLGTWIGAARPLTLALAIAPVALGTGAASLGLDVWYEHWARAVLCLAVAALLQIGVNYANDYSDGIRGTDAHRVGPSRLVGSGRAKPRHVLVAALVFFGLAAVAGLTLVIVTQQWWLLAVGAVAIVAAWFYTGGTRPYGYAGLGELVVFVFFGVVAVAGTTFVQLGTVNIEAWLGVRRPASSRWPCCTSTTSATGSRMPQPESAPSRCGSGSCRRASSTRSSCSCPSASWCSSCCSTSSRRMCSSCCSRRFRRSSSS